MQNCFEQTGSLRRFELPVKALKHRKTAIAFTQAQYLRLRPDEKQEAGPDSGLLVQQASGPAAMAGVQSGDVLISINGVPVKNIEQTRVAAAGRRRNSQYP